MEEQQSRSSETSLPAHEVTGVILRSVLKSTEKENKRAYDVLVALADQGLLDRHQTRGAIDTMAKRLLNTLEGEDA